MGHRTRAHRGDHRTPPVIDDNGDEWVTIAEAAQRARVRRSTIDNWTSRGTVRRLDNRRPVLVAWHDVATAEHAWRTRTTTRKDRAS